MMMRMSVCLSVMHGLAVTCFCFCMIRDCRLLGRICVIFMHACSGLRAGVRACMRYTWCRRIDVTKSPRERKKECVCASVWPFPGL